MFVYRRATLVNVNMEQDVTIGLKYRPAGLADVSLMAEMNHQLIRDEGHENQMTLPELATRMKRWLNSEYRGVLFEHRGGVVAYALYRSDPGWVYLRQFFVHRDYRRQGIGRAAIQILLSKLFPPDARVTVDVLYHNHPAHDFWRAVGFRDHAVTLEMNRP
jgi:GNAT superfamily N-acetyltransferase